MTNKALKQQSWKNVKRESSDIITAGITCIIIDGGLIGIASWFSALFFIMYGLMILFGFVIAKIVVGKAKFYMNIAQGKEAYFLDIFSFFNDEDYKRIKHCYIRKFAIISIYIMIIYYGVMILICEFTGIDNVFGITHLNYYFNRDIEQNAVLLAIFMILFGVVMYVLYGAKYLFLEYVIVDKYNESKNVFIKDFKNNGYRNFNNEIFAINNRLINGNYLRAIKLMLSFTGGFLLSILTFGLGFIIFIPYYNETIALFYIQERNRYNKTFNIS